MLMNNEKVPGETFPVVGPRTTSANRKLQLQVIIVFWFELLTSIAFMEGAHKWFTSSNLSLEIFCLMSIFGIKQLCNTTWVVEVSTRPINTLENLKTNRIKFFLQFNYTSEYNSDERIRSCSLLQLYFLANDIKRSQRCPWKLKKQTCKWL